MNMILREQVPSTISVRHVLLIATMIALSNTAIAQAEPDWLSVDGFEEFVSPPDAFRITTLALRDPHVFVTVPPLCLDFTDTAIPSTGFSLNGQIAATLTGDADNDGFLDASTLLLFRPLDRTTPLARLEQIPARCTFPAATTSCESLPTPITPTVDYFDTREIGSCLAPLPGTTGNNPPSLQYPPYSPAVTSASGPCLRTGTRAGTVGDVGLALPLVDVQLGATFGPSPTDQLVNGLIRGFLPEAVADSIQIPLPDPPGGTVALSSLLPGGTGFCTGAIGSTRNNKDTYQGVSGWWFYFNFTANRVPYSGP